MISNIITSASIIDGKPCASVLEVHSNRLDAISAYQSLISEALEMGAEIEHQKEFSTIFITLLHWKTGGTWELKLTTCRTRE